MNVDRTDPCLDSSPPERTALDPLPPDETGTTPRRFWRRRFLTLAALTGGMVALVIGLWAAAAGPVAAQPSGAATVNMVDFEFEQKSITIPVGTSLSWANTGERPHTATDRGGTFDTQPVNPGETGSITLTAPGTYFYFCRINPVKMNGIVVVTPTGTPSPAVRVQTIDPTNIEGESLRFDTPKLEVAAGTTLLVANVGGKPHSLSAEDGSFSTGIIQPGPEGGRFAGSNATLTLNTPGTFNFFCDVHPQAMKGTVVVSGTPPPTTPAPASNGARSAEVTIADFEFEQAQISVGPGAEVTFRNVGDAPHTATFDDVKLDTGNLDTGGKAVLIAPTQPGSYSYFCGVHTKMRGVLVVLGQNTADPLASPNPNVGAASAGNSDVGQGGATVTAAPSPPPVATAGAGSSSAMSIWVIATVAIACFLGGVGMTPLLSRRPRASTA